jgi:hypothetical protein
MEVTKVDLQLLGTLPAAALAAEIHTLQETIIEDTYVFQHTGLHFNINLEHDQHGHRTRHQGLSGST